MISVRVCIQSSYGMVCCILLTVDIISCYGCGAILWKRRNRQTCLKSSASLSLSVSEQAKNENESKQQCAAKSSRATPSP